jgi:hypothetical protein
VCVCVCVCVRECVDFLLVTANLAMVSNYTAFLTL